MSEFEGADGTRLYYEIHGEAGPAIVFSCAFTTTHVNWHPQVDALVGAGLRVVLWDYRGHGLSGVPDKDSAYTMDAVVDFYENFR